MNRQQAPVGVDADLERLERLRDARDRIRAQIRRTVIGQEQVVDLLLMSLFARGHCILEGVPGLAKTLLVRTLADTLSLSFARIQFTPDLMPSDITGTEVMQEDRATGAREFRFVKGPIFHSVLLADEINRTPPKTQAALLEGMQEGQVSAGGTRYPLPEPFLVLATQNPIEHEGTYPLPEAQLDRFLFKIFVGYPDVEEEKQIYRMASGARPEPIEHVLNAQEVLELQRTVRGVPVSDYCLDYAIRLVRSTRPDDAGAPDFVRQWLLYGAGPRGGQWLIQAARARAALAGRPQVQIDDVRFAFKPVLRHRLVLHYSAEADGQTADTILDRLVNQTPEAGQIDERVARVFES